MKSIKLACFDLDDTLIRKVHSVMIPCIINNKEIEHNLIQQKEEDGELDYISADHQRAQLLKGLHESKLKNDFLKYARPLKNINETIKTLHNNGIRCIVVTVGPIQMAKVVSDLWGFDDFYGSEYEVKNEIFTGEILNYVSSEKKIECLRDYCDKTGTNFEECVSIGDGATDIPMFKACGSSIAINASQKVKQESKKWVDTDDLKDILGLIL